MPVPTNQHPVFSVDLLSFTLKLMTEEIAPFWSWAAAVWDCTPGRTVVTPNFLHNVDAIEIVNRIRAAKGDKLVRGLSKTADARQAGGDHYKKLKVQPWDAMEAWLTPEEFRGFLKGNIIKYIARANSGKEDHDLMMEKAAHYQQKLDEMLIKWKSS